MYAHSFLIRHLPIYSFDLIIHIIQGRFVDICFCDGILKNVSRNDHNKTLQSEKHVRMADI